MAEERATPTSLYCSRCRRTLKTTEFYKSHNREKYPNGFLEKCKSCITAHVDNYDPKTFAWILQECDVPYMPSEWDNLLAKYGKDPGKLVGSSIVGRYIGKMYMKQYKDYRWADTQRLQELKQKEIRESLESIGKPQEVINEAVDNSRAVIDGVIGEDGSAIHEDRSDYNDYISPNASAANVIYEGQRALAEEKQLNTIEQEVIGDLTDEDRRYLFLKWGRYTPHQWIKLETFYTQMVNSMGIEDPGDLNTLILACKASLKANELLDMADVEGAQKMTKIYESMMKTGNWTAQDRKTSSDNIDCIGVLALACEKEDGYIPRFYVDKPNDKADKVILDMQKYTHDLIKEESGLGQLFENALRQREEEAESIAAARAMSEKNGLDEDDLLFDFAVKPLSDEDITDFGDFEEELAEDDFRSAYNDAIAQTGGVG